ncbi:MAG: hypothetical protein ABL956_09715 [Hyphomonadaceae bacterium]
MSAPAVEIDIGRVKARSVTIDAEAASKLTLDGPCTKLDSVLGAASQAKAEGLKCCETHIDSRHAVQHPDQRPSARLQ